MAQRNNDNRWSGAGVAQKHATLLLAHAHPRAPALLHCAASRLRLRPRRGARYRSKPQARLSIPQPQQSPPEPCPDTHFAANAVMQAHRTTCPSTSTSAARTTGNSVSPSGGKDGKMGCLLPARSYGFARHGLADGLPCCGDGGPTRRRTWTKPRSSSLLMTRYTVVNH